MNNANNPFLDLLVWLKINPVLSVIVMIVAIILGAIVWHYATLKPPRTRIIAERKPTNDQDLRKTLTLAKGADGLGPLIYRPKQAGKKDPFAEQIKSYHVSNECRGLVVGASGTGKTSFIIPQIVDWLQSGRSVIVTDIKPEIYNILKALGVFERYGYNPIVINPTNDIEREDYYTYNMLADISKEEHLDEFLTVLIPSTSSETQAFADFARIIFKAVFYKQHLDGITPSLSSVYDYLNDFGNIEKLLKSLKNTESNQNLANKVTALANQALIAGDNERFRASGYNALMQALKFLSSETIAKNLSQGSLSEVLTEPRYIIFLQFEQQYQSSNAALYSATVQHLVNMLMANFQEREAMFLVLDELINGGKIANLADKFNTMRSFNIPTFLYIQNIIGLEERYGKAEAQKIISACDVRICFRANDTGTANYFSGDAGNIKVMIKHYSDEGKLEREDPKDEPLLKPEDIKNLENGVFLVIHKGKSAVVAVPKAIHHNL